MDNQETLQQESQREHPRHAEVRSRNEAFAERTSTRIWGEQASSDNPYIATHALCQGYDLFQLMEKRSFVDVFYLLFRGELPTEPQAQLLQALMIALINPGPRHPATRAAINAGVSKSHPVHLLPIASAVLGGDYLGGGDVAKSVAFFNEQLEKGPLEINPNLAIPPGFGPFYGGVDLLSQGIAERLASLAAAGPALAYGMRLSEALAEQGAGWLCTGVAGAVLADLGFSTRAAAALYQLLGAPGLVAHGIEAMGKPITAMPFVSDEDYSIER